MANPSILVMGYGSIGKHMHEKIADDALLNGWIASPERNHGRNNK